MISLRSSILAGAVLVSAFASAQDVKVEKYTLPNGMTVILHEDHSVPVAAVNIWFRVGSKDEADRRSGFAHLFEHLMFMGTERVPTGQYDKIMEGGGGANNASTAEDRTNYFDSGPASLLPTLLWLEADRLEDLGRTMTLKKVDLQREVVKNERRQNTENTPYGKSFEALNGLLYPAGHPYHTSVIGSHEDLSAATLKDVQDFFSTYYVPNNASLVVAGDFSSAEVKPMIAKLFGTLPRQNDVPRKAVPPVAYSGVRRVTLVDKVQFPRTLMAWPSPAAYKPGDLDLSIAAQILSSGVSSRLYHRLVTQDKLASDVSAFQNSLSLGSYFAVYATAAEGVPLDKLEAALEDELSKFIKTGPSGSELSQQIAQWELSTLNGIQSASAKADKLNEYEFYFGEPNSFKRVLDMARATTPGSVREAVRKSLDMNNRLVMHIVPEQEPPKENPRTARPGMDASKPYSAQKPTEFSLSNGIKVQFWQRDELPLVSLVTQFGAGADSDDAKSEGLASLTAEMLSQGTSSLSAESFEMTLNQLGASFSAGVGHANASASFSTLARNFEKTLGLYTDALTRPRMNEDDFARLQRLTLSNIAQSEDSADQLARKVSTREFFGMDHPLGRPTGGTLETVKSLTVAAAKTERGKIFNPATATIYVAGNLTETDLKAKLEATLGKWKDETKAAVNQPYGPVKNSTLRVVIVDKPKAVQTVITFMMPGTKYDDPNRPTLESLNVIFGGSFTSRLNQNLREDKGYTYGAGSRFTFNRELGYFTARSSVRTDVTGASLKEFLSEFERIRAGDVSEVEASKAAATRRNETIESLGTLGGLVGTAAGLSAMGHQFTDVASELVAMDRVKAANINALVRSALALDAGLIVLVGDRAEIEKQIAGLPLPKAEIVKP